MSYANVKQSKWYHRNNPALANVPKLRNAVEHKLIPGDMLANTLEAAILAANAFDGTLGAALEAIGCDDPSRWSDKGAPVKRTIVGFNVPASGMFCCPRHVGVVAYRDIRDGDIVPVFSDEDHEECEGCKA